MKKIITKPYLFFFLLVPIIFILGIIFKEEVIDINISYTYFVISYNHLSYLFAFFFALVGLNYFSLWWAKKQPKKSLTIFHITFQIISLLLFFTKNNWNWIGKNDYPPEVNLLTDNSNIIILISILVFIISAFFHLINFFLSLFSKSK